MDMIDLHMFDYRGQRCGRGKWIHQFEGVTSIIFAVDLSSYCQGDRMIDTLDLFAVVVNSGWFTRSSIILLFSNLHRFKERLATHTLNKCFPDYSGKNDVDSAVKHIIWRFNQVGQAHQAVYAAISDPTDVSPIVRLMSTVIKETAIENSMRDSGILTG
jgi:guanine nucleotide-binding protein G(i) subunit alpha